MRACLENSIDTFVLFSFSFNYQIQNILPLLALPTAGIIMPILFTWHFKIDKIDK